MEHPFVVSGKAILITGAASGIGRATALLCAQMGAQVTITDLNDPDGWASGSVLSMPGRLT